MGYSCGGLILLLSTVGTLVAGALAAEDNKLEPGNWDSCKPGAEAPDTRVPTLDFVNHLRMYFASNYIEAYIVANEDAHQSEYVSEYDMRRAFMSGFKGSAGTVVITVDKAALWTDGRYFLEAENTLDCSWILMRQGETGVPSIEDWLKQEVKAGSRVGANPFLISSATWKKYAESLGESGIHMQAVYNELVDLIWNNNRPPRPNTDINPLPIQFAGRTWQDKVTDMRNAMTEKNVDMMVVTGLDEIAWLFNLRANDIPYNPFFIAYAIIEKGAVRLYILDHIKKISKEPSDKASESTVADFLNTDSKTGSCKDRQEMCVEVKLYDPDTVLGDVQTSGGTASKVWLGFSCNYAIYSKISTDKIYQANTPIATTKTMKNPVEVEGMKNAHIRDAVAFMAFMAKLEQEVKEDKKWTELSAAKKLEEYRSKQKYNRGESFQTISSAGSNGAIIHYKPSAETNKQITKDTVYLLDSGGQYLDGTTDITRTFHFGTPTDYEKECYTRVLMGHINLFQTMWPKGLYGREIDAIARGPLWDVGLVYRHGTGHGIGMYLSVHEGPGRISGSHSSYGTDNVLDVGQFYSDEPGYYEAGKFGIRLENIVMVKNATTKYTFPGTQFLTFEHVTLVPYEPNLINYDLLSDKQIQYLNDYHQLCRDTVGPELERQKEKAGYDWLMEKSASYERPQASRSTSGAGHIVPQIQAMIVPLVVSLSIVLLRFC